MFSIGFFELFIISIIALVILGPERLPQFIRWVEETIKSIRASFNKTSKEIKDSIYVEDHNKKNDWTEGCIAVSNQEMQYLWKIVKVDTPILIVR